ncbi:hypothetical protein CspeluHIS016_0210520 [Cutaneotrichosporon spelunceum]|uniref:WD repeat-containing protein JIP5 n=1 Tax=Cutaneotrichosporon spelunceum TaxID=1672016 RepID=A0AAD3TT31_9TREE|nr:hypothetical protein CspeluHIS016_0210520 [Cutaneotrichosporon spelunceum]
MPEIKLRNQPFDVAFSPSADVLCAALLTGEVKAWAYDEDGEATRSWSVRPTKRTARAVHFSPDGASVWMGGKSGVLVQIDTSTGTVIHEHTADSAPINRVHALSPHLVAAGADDGVIRFWDARSPTPAREYTHHWDYISDLAVWGDKLLATSGDGTLSAIDLRRAKAEPALSGDQEDELLSIAQVKGGAGAGGAGGGAKGGAGGKFVVGTGLGVLSIWDPSRGWGDSVDRMLGHPASVDAIVAISDDVVATGSEDGMVRVIQIQPNAFLGVIATHDEYPIERLALDRSGRWLASVSHDECIKLTDCQGIFEDDDDVEMEDSDVDMAQNDSDEEEESQTGDIDKAEERQPGDSDEAEAKRQTADWGSDSDEPQPRPKKTRKGQHKVGRERVHDSAGFFDDL